MVYYGSKMWVLYLINFDLGLFGKEQVDNVSPYRNWISNFPIDPVSSPRCSLSTDSNETTVFITTSHSIAYPLITRAKRFGSWASEVFSNWRNSNNFIASMALIDILSPIAILHVRRLLEFQYISKENS